MVQCTNIYYYLFINIYFNYKLYLFIYKYIFINNIYYSIYYPFLNEDEIELASCPPHLEEPRVQD